MDFILPKWGGAMIHSDLQLTEIINLPAPKQDIAILWHRNKLVGEKAGAIGNGIAGNGTIAACTFRSALGKDNLVIYDYDGNRIWTSGNMLNAVATVSTPMVDVNNRVIACDNKKLLMVDPFNTGKKVQWISDIPYEGSGVLLPFSPTIVNGKTIILPTNGPVYAYDLDGKLLAEIRLGMGEIDGKEYFFSVNSACVNGNRVYVTTEFNIPGRMVGDLQRGRLYALDVNLNAEDGEIFSIAWSFPFIGTSQASPILIDDTIYFDGFTPGLFNKAYIYAVTDKGDSYVAQQIPYPDQTTILPRRTMFSFSKDPRGGFWYEDHRGKRLVRFDDKDLHIIEEIRLKTLSPRPRKAFRPLSCLTICDEKNPIMLVSATSILFGQYLIAIDLNADNAVLWKVKIGVFNYAGGQFTILKKNNDPSKNRIVFGTYWDGVMAIGTAD